MATVFLLVTACLSSLWAFNYFRENHIFIQAGETPSTGQIIGWCAFGYSAFAILLVSPILFFLALCGVGIYGAYWHSQSNWKETRILNESLQKMFAEFKRPSDAEMVQQVTSKFISQIRAENLERPVAPLFVALQSVIHELYDAEQFPTKGPPFPSPWLYITPHPQWTTQAVLEVSTPPYIPFQKRLTNAPQVLEAFTSSLASMTALMVKTLPPVALRPLDVNLKLDTDGLFASPLKDMLPAPDAFIRTIAKPLFTSANEQLDVFTTERKLLAYEKLDKVPAEALMKLKLARLLDVPISFDLADTDRFRHQWVVGDTGAGKTTFISAMLAQDFKRVERGEASVFVMDSQNELIPDIARLDIFGPGGPLHGKLIYLEPDPDYPLALNIFDVNREGMGTLSNKDRTMLESGALWMVDFFLSSLVKSEASPHQDTFLNYIVPALMVIPDATIFTFKELLEPAPRNGPAPGYEKYKKYFTRLHPDTQQWLETRMHSTELAATRSAIRARLDGFTARGLFRDMFSHPRNKLDLFNELQSSKVILVNTMKGLLKQGTEPFGRYFIARLVQAMEERMFLARGKKLPVFAYIDEASDYIADDENVEELLDKARKQSMGFIFANQREAQITNPRVRDALSRAAIQARGQARGPSQPPHWTLTISKQDPINVLVPNVSFSKMPGMEDAQFEDMLRQMRAKYGNPATYHAQGGEEIIIDAEYHEVVDRPSLPPPEDEDTDPKPWPKQ
jgi:hypothetical protein